MSKSICVECEFYAVAYWDGTRRCLSPDAPISNYVTGVRRCKDINWHGDCRFFEQAEEPEPVQPPPSRWSRFWGFFRLGDGEVYK